MISIGGIFDFWFINVRPINCHASWGCVWGNFKNTIQVNKYSVYGPSAIPVFLTCFDYISQICTVEIIIDNTFAVCTPLTGRASFRGVKPKFLTDTLILYWFSVTNLNHQNTSYFNLKDGFIAVLWTRSWIASGLPLHLKSLLTEQSYLGSDEHASYAFLVIGHIFRVS